MPRITYHDRFAALLAKDYISSRDRAFAESLYTSYKRKRSLTSGRRRCFLQLEERYATRPEPVAGAEELCPLLARLAELDPGSWDERFVTSVRSQLLGGRELSDRQTEILAKIQVKYNDEAMSERDQWFATWNAEKGEAYRVAVGYYRTTGYFRRQVSAYDQNPEATPSMEDFKRLTDNKFARKVLAGWFSEPRFPVGSMVALGSGATYAARRACPNKHNLCVVVGVNAAIPSSAAKGCKVYKLLPVGGATMFLCEERQLKRARTPKKKK